MAPVAKSVVTLATRTTGIEPWETPPLVCVFVNTVVQVVGVGGLFMVKCRQVLEKEKKLVVGIWVWGEFISVRNLPNSDPAQKILDISNMYCPKIILQVWVDKSSDIIWIQLKKQPVIHALI